MMPTNLVLVRHGESDGNVAVESAKNGDTRYYTDKFMTIPGHQWRLSPKGVMQAKTTGAWIQENMPDFDRYIVSPFVRTRETAALLGLKDAQWRMNREVREREWGDIDSMLKSVFQSRFPDNYVTHKKSPLYWCPPGGESIADVAGSRVHNLLTTLHRECSDQNVIVVSHGEFMWATRIVLQRWSDEEYLLRDADKSQKIHNAQVIHFTRVNPDTGETADKMKWVRIVSPAQKNGEWVMEEKDWEFFDPQPLSNEELYESIAHFENAVDYS